MSWCSAWGAGPPLPAHPAVLSPPTASGTPPVRAPTHGPAPPAGPGGWNAGTGSGSWSRQRTCRSRPLASDASAAAGQGGSISPYPPPPPTSRRPLQPAPSAGASDGERPVRDPSSSRSHQQEDGRGSLPPATGGGTGRVDPGRPRPRRQGCRPPVTVRTCGSYAPWPPGPARRRSGARLPGWRGRWRARSGLASGGAARHHHAGVVGGEFEKLGMRQWRRAVVGEPALRPPCLAPARWGPRLGGRAVCRRWWRPASVRRKAMPTRRSAGVLGPGAATATASRPPSDQPARTQALRSPPYAAALRRAKASEASRSARPPSSRSGRSPGTNTNRPSPVASWGERVQHVVLVGPAAAQSRTTGAGWWSAGGRPAAASLRRGRPAVGCSRSRPGSPVRWMITEGQLHFLSRGR
ncbi:hypothetical protein KAURM247S_01895 [Kitasatospora aureofaciens]